MMPILRVFSNGTVLAIFPCAGKKGGGLTASFTEPERCCYLPTIMGEGTIGLGHSMGIFLFLDRRAAIIRSVEDLRRQFLFHRFLGALARRVNEPTHA